MECRIKNVKCRIKEKTPKGVFCFLINLQIVSSHTLYDKKYNIKKETPLRSF